MITYLLLYCLKMWEEDYYSCYIFLRLILYSFFNFGETNQVIGRCHRQISPF